MNEISKAPFQLKECFCPNKTKKMIKTIIALSALVIPVPFCNAAVMAKAMFDVVGGPASSGDNVITNDVKVLNTDISLSPGTYFNSTSLYFQIHDSSGSFNVNDIQYVVYEPDNTTVFRGEIDDNENISNLSVFNSLFVGFNSSAVMQTGTIEDKSLSTMILRIESPTLRTRMNTQLVNDGDIMTGSVQFTYGGTHAVVGGKNQTVGGTVITVPYSLEVVAVPEPSSTLLIGLGGMTLILRRKK